MASAGNDRKKPVIFRKKTRKKPRQIGGVNRYRQV
jgi:hypothetical protein